MFQESVMICNIQQMSQRKRKRVNEDKSNKTS